MMKRLLILLTFFVATAQGFAQSGTYDRLWSRYSLQLRDWRLDSVKRDTNFLNYTHSIPTADAIARYVAGRAAAPGRKETFTGSTSSSITLSQAPADTAATLVFLNGVLLHASDYSISGATLTLGFSRLSTDVVNVTYPLSSIVTGSTLPSQSGNAGKVLSTDGSSASWQALTYIDVTRTPYSADNTGTADATTAINSALSAAATGTIKEVVLPPGAYKIDGTLSVPANVTLRGSFRAPHSFSQNYNAFWGSGHDQPIATAISGKAGTILLVTGHHNDSAATEAITLTNNSKLEGVTLYWPNQSASATPVPYPWAVRADTANNAAVENVELLNAFRGIYFSQVHRGTIRNVTGQVLYQGVKTEGGGDVTRWENIHFGAWWSYNTTAWTWASTNATAFIIGREDDFNASNCFAWGVKTGYHFVESPQYANDGFGGSGPTGAWAELRNCGADYTGGSNIIADYGQPQAISFVGGHYTNQANVPIVKVNSTFKGRLQLKNLYLFSGQGKYMDIAGNNSLVSADGCLFSGYYAPTGSGWAQNTLSNTGIVAGGTGAVAVRNCEFVTTQPQISLASTLNRAHFSGNMIAGPISVSNSMTAGYVITDNAVDTSALYGGSTVAGAGSATTYYEAQMTGANGTSLSSYTPETGSHTVALGSFTLNGSGEAVSHASAYSRLVIGGTLPANRKVTVVGKVVAANTALLSVQLRENGGNYLQALAFVNGSDLQVSIDQNGTTQGSATVVSGYTGTEITFEAWMEGDVIYARINGGTPLSFTTTVTGDVTRINAANGGGTINSITVQSLE